MATRLQNLWQVLVRQRSGRKQESSSASLAERPRRPVEQRMDIAPDDPVLQHFQNAPGVVDLDMLSFDSPALREMRAAGVKLVLPLVTQGELIGLVNLGRRLSEQDYSSDDRRLLNDLATQAAPAVRVAQLAHQQQAEAAERERLLQELRVARLIQQTLLPKEVPAIRGWHMSAYYQPARAVGGDFYDFFTFPNGQLGLVIGDVTDKGVPAALVMATTRAILRGAAQRIDSPGDVLERANELLYPDIPGKMFVTCLYAILDPSTGHLRFANAGHDLPYRRTANGVMELRATGMPLGLMPGMRYEEREVTLEPGEQVIFYSDGLVEAHSPDRELFGFPRLQELMALYDTGADLIAYLLDELAAFTGPEWEQEDDVTLVTLARTGANPPFPERPQTKEGAIMAPVSTDTTGAWRLLEEFSLPSDQGNERIAMAKVAGIVASPEVPWLLSPERLQRLRTAVAETTMNAIEHGNGFQSEIPVVIQVLASDEAISIHITDRGGGKTIKSPGTPDIEAKLAGLQSPRGWGLFLIEKMVDEMHITSDGTHHTVELLFFRKGE
jgi:serine phosphatase RsbU (regulator of sigma subunit)/anti-sigma regulatory factor (Ser/Thr protein kinase)